LGRYRRLFLLLCLIVVTFLPLAGGWAHWQGLPPGYGAFPPQKLVEPPGFNSWYFGVGCAAVAVLVAFFVVPRIFGFKRPPPAPPIARGPLPYWFWPGLVVMFVSWYFHWFGSGLLARYSFVPLWWGLIYALDGVVYSLSAGRSLIAGRKQEMLTLAVVSVVGWYLFEYWNYFVLENWVYPYAGLLSPFDNIVWFSLSYTTVWPSCFEWYMLLMTIPALRLRWSDGPKLKLPGWFIVGGLGLGFGLQFLMGLMPFPFFWALWIGSLLVLWCSLALGSYWTPLAPAARGNWTRLALMALGTLCDGIFWEGWNHGSQAFRQGVGSNPNYWVYDIPYVNVIHLFSEMPLLGYFGYLFFGLLVWVYWLVIAHLFKLDPDFAHGDLVGPSEGDEYAGVAA
jgi:hypothetical protein